MKHKLYIQLWGGLGDVVLTTPVFREIKTRQPETTLIVICRNRNDMEILKNNPYIDQLKLLTFFRLQWYALLQATGLMKVMKGNYGKLRPSFTSQQKAAELIAGMMGWQLKDSRIRIYLDAKEDRQAQQTLLQYKNPVVIHISSIASKNQMWPLENWNKLASQMPEFTFIQLGLPNEELVEGAVDMRGRTSIREAAALIKHAVCFAGVVSFLAHVTNAFDTPGVVFYGPSSVPVWGHPNNINITKNLPCAGCIDWLNVPCPYGKPCMTQITVQEVRAAILQQAQKRKGSVPAGKAIEKQLSI